MATVLLALVIIAVSECTQGWYDHDVENESLKKVECKLDWQPNGTHQQWYDNQTGVTIDILRPGLVVPPMDSCAPAIYQGSKYVESFGRSSDLLRKPGNKTQCLPPNQTLEAWCYHVPGVPVFIGMIQPQYGNFLLDSIARLWAFTAIVTKRFQFSVAIFYARALRHTSILRRVNISEIFNVSNVILPTDRPIVFPTLALPMKLFVINYKRHYEGRPAMATNLDLLNFAVYEHIARWATRQYIVTESDKGIARCIYISRSGTGKRAVVNEDEVEAKYRSYGFFVARPGPDGSWSFAKEVAYYNNAYVVAGFAGSNLHNSVFMKPGGTLIEMHDSVYAKKKKGTDWGLTNQRLLASMNNLTIHLINISAVANDVDNVRANMHSVDYELGKLADVISRANC